MSSCLPPRLNRPAGGDVHFNQLQRKIVYREIEHGTMRSRMPISRLRASRFDRGSLVALCRGQITQRRYRTACQSRGAPVVSAVNHRFSVVLLSKHLARRLQTPNVLNLTGYLPSQVRPAARQQAVIVLVKQKREVSDSRA